MSNESSISWPRLGAILVGLISLGFLALLLVRQAGEAPAVAWSPITQEVAAVQKRPPHPDRLLYEHPELRFSLELPKRWADYRVFMAETDDPDLRLISITLPVEHFEGQLTDPKQLKEGVMVVGVRARTNREGQIESSVESPLGHNADTTFYPIPLAVFENGFKSVPSELTQEIEAVYQSFQTW